MPLERFACRCFVTDVGETDAATLACCEVKAACTAGGTEIPAGRAKPSAHITRIVSKPERKGRIPAGLPGVGVVERLPMASSALRLLADDFLPLSQDIVVVDTKDNYKESAAFKKMVSQTGCEVAIKKECVMKNVAVVCCQSFLCATTRQIPN